MLAEPTLHCEELYAVESSYGVTGWLPH